MFKKIDKEQIDAWVERAYANAKRHGWHEKEKSDKHWLMMIATEIAEAVQADRKGRWFDEFTKSGLECVLANDHHNGLVEKFYEDNIEGTVESELADICIRIFDFLGVKGEHINGDIITSQHNIINFRCSSFTENAFKISNMIFEDEILDDNLRATFLSSTLRYMFQWAEAVGVNLQQQIELKMRYNESREYMHGGKKY